MAAARASADANPDILPVSHNRYYVKGKRFRNPRSNIPVFLSLDNDRSTHLIALGNHLHAKQEELMEKIKYLLHKRDGTLYIGVRHTDKMVEGVRMAWWTKEHFRCYIESLMAELNVPDEWYTMKLVCVFPNDHKPPRCRFLEHDDRMNEYSWNTKPMGHGTEQIAHAREMCDCDRLSCSEIMMYHWNGEVEKHRGEPYVLEVKVHPKRPRRKLCLMPLSRRLAQVSSSSSD